MRIMTTTTMTLSALALLAGACSRQKVEVSHPADTAETYALTSDWPTFVQGPDSKVDILFMVDNSLSMKPFQAQLVSGFSSLMTALEGLPGGTPDLHIGVVSSDMGAGMYDVDSVPGCRRGGDGGNLWATPSASCQGLSLPQPFLTVHTDPTTQRLVTNYGARPLAEAFGCIAMVGDSGCGFEQPFSSVRHALDPALAPAGNAGFLRPDALLAVVLVTNEDDCSIPADSTLFDPTSRYVSDPEGPLSSFRCNEYGHLCKIDGKLQPPPRDKAGQLMECESNEDGRLDKVGDFVTFLKNLKGDPARVFLAAVTGPATPYTVALNPGTLVDDPSPWPSIGRSCTSGVGLYADPSVRVAQAVKAFGSHGLLSTICGTDMSPILHEISSGFSRPLASPCVPTPAAGGPGCTVVDRWIDETGARQAARLPACDEAAGATPCWSLVADDATCGATARRLVVDRAGTDPAANLVSAIDCTAPHP
jgi:hypothetical protein